MGIGVYSERPITSSLIECIYSIMINDYATRKIVCVVSDTLESWQALNIVGHLAISLGANKDTHLMGRDVLIDTSGISHKGIARYGLIIKKGDPISIRNVLQESRHRNDIEVFDFLREMLETSDDDELNYLISKKDEVDLEYLGAMFYGPTDVVTVLTERFRL